MRRTVIIRGWTLVEVLGVAMILAVLAGIVALVAGPRMKRSATVAEAGNHLRQLSFALNLYMNEHDGLPPRTIEPLLSGLPARDPLGGSWLYSWVRFTPDREGIDFADYGFEIGKDAVFRCSRVHNHRGKVETLVMRVDGHPPIVQHVPILDAGQKLGLLGSRLDGSVGWFPSPPNWELALPQGQDDPNNPGRR